MRFHDFHLFCDFSLWHIFAFGEKGKNVPRKDHFVEREKKKKERKRSHHFFLLERKKWDPRDTFWLHYLWSEFFSLFFLLTAVSGCTFFSMDLGSAEKKETTRAKMMMCESSNGYSHSISFSLFLSHTLSLSLSLFPFSSLCPNFSASFHRQSDVSVLARKPMGTSSWLAAYFCLILTILYSSQGFDCSTS